uniref:p33 n=12 Tax=Citrus tristeza virus TaxID=12162 RepID=M9Z6X5_9CLOS|nr:p33 [Citrus tristeza virus]AGK30073.1 p33 [Citrus tristeza virus]AGK30085.1 p33 [Citrus tristeza virus]AGK30097.1 p33 [Citrus tristeza virus]
MFAFASESQDLLEEKVFRRRTYHRKYFGDVVKDFTIDIGYDTTDRDPTVLADYFSLYFFLLNNDSVGPIAASIVVSPPVSGTHKIRAHIDNQPNCEGNVTYVKTFDKSRFVIRVKAVPASMRGYYSFRVFLSSDVASERSEFVCSFVGSRFLCCCTQTISENLSKVCSSSFFFRAVSETATNEFSVATDDVEDVKYIRKQAEGFSRCADPYPPRCYRSTNLGDSSGVQSRTIEEEGYMTGTAGNVAVTVPNTPLVSAVSPYVAEYNENARSRVSLIRRVCCYAVCVLVVSVLIMSGLLAIIFI